MKSVPALTQKIPLRFRDDGTFKICCFSDLHETADYDPRSLAALDGIIARENPDLVLLGGDIWNGALDRPIEELKAFLDVFTAPMERRGIPWAHVMGNHDHFYCFGDAAYQALFESYPHCISSHTDPDAGVDGVTNFVLPIRSSDERRIAFAVWGLDTHELSDRLTLRNGVNLRQGHRVASPITGTSHWDFVHFNQIHWYYHTSEALEKENGAPIDALMLLHAAPLEYGICMDNPAETHLEGDAQETLFSGSLNSGLIATVLQRGDVRAMVCGHMHANTFSADYCGIKLCFDGSIGFKTGGIDALRGGRVFEINENDTARPATRYVYAKDVIQI